MFSPPPTIEARTFARIPEKYLITDRESDWGRIHIGQSDLPVFLEGPSFDLSGNLWLVDIPWGRLFRVSPDGIVDCAFEYDGRPNGLKFDRSGTAFIADGKNGLMRFDPGNRTIEPVIENVLLQSFKGLNDLCFADNGDLYFTDQGHTGLHDPTGCVYRLSRGGTLERLLGNVPSPNGLVLSPDNGVLYVAATRGNAVWRVPLVDHGQVIRAGIFIQLSGGSGPDGLALTEDGGLAVCHLGMGAVWIFSPRGEPVFRINTPNSLHVTNLAFGGADRRTLFMTTPSEIMVAEVPVAGARMFSGF